MVPLVSHHGTLINVESEGRIHARPSTFNTHRPKKVEITSGQVDCRASYHGNASSDLKRPIDSAQFHTRHD